MAQKEQQGKTNPTNNDPFPYASNFDKAIFEKLWYLPLFLPYIISKLLFIPIYAAEKPLFRFWSGEDMIYLAIPAMLLVILIPYNSWTLSIRPTFDILGTRLKITSNKKQNKYKISRASKATQVNL